MSRWHSQSLPAVHRAWERRSESLLDSSHGPHDELADFEDIDSTANQNTRTTNNDAATLMNMHGLLPARYIQDPLRAHPSLDTLRAALPAQEDSIHTTTSTAAAAAFKSPTRNIEDVVNNPTTALRQVSLPKLLYAADQDALLHTLRKRAVLEKNPALLDANYTREVDTVWVQRQARLTELTHHVQSLQDETIQILKQLDQVNWVDSSVGNKLRSKVSALSSSSSSGTAWIDAVRQGIPKWERAMDLYIYCATTDSFLSTVGNSSSSKIPSLMAVQEAQAHFLTMYQLLDKLIVATSSSSSSQTPSSSTTTATTSEQVLSHILTDTTHLAESMLQNISQLVQDATIHLMEAQDSFRIRLDAHAYIAHKAIQQVQYQVQETFLAQGKEAVLIGRALQVSETQLRQCEYATLLLQHWWTLETLAQQEVLNQNMMDTIKVVEEVRGLVPMNNCKLDPIFTQPQYSLEAARILKSLRWIVRQGGGVSGGGGIRTTRSRTLSQNITETILEETPLDSNVVPSSSAESSLTVQKKSREEKGDEEKKVQSPSSPTAAAATTTTATLTTLLDPKAGQRFDLTHNLIQRVSAALEQRLLNTFSEIYTRGGSYDFSSIQVAWKYQLSSKSTHSLDWMTLRDVAEALMNFDQGRSLHKRYLSLVISTKFPELFLETRKNRRNKRNEEGDDEEDEDVDEEGNEFQEPKMDSDADQPEFDMDDMRTQLATLFHRVSEVCGAEFQLIAHIFSPSLPMNLEYERRSFQQRAASRTGKVFNMGRNGNVSQSCFPETFPLTIARSLIRHIISDPVSGMQARIDQLLDMIDKKGGDFDAVAKKLDTFVVIHEKAAGLFSLLRESAMTMWGVDRVRLPDTTIEADSASEKSANALDHNPVHVRAVASLVQFLNTQEVALISNHRRDYLNLELRLLHHQCCACLDGAGATFAKFIMLPPKEDLQVRSSASNVSADDLQYRAPILPLDKESILKGSFVGLLNGPLKQSILRQPLIHATDSLARARLMFGRGLIAAAPTPNSVTASTSNESDSTARVIVSIFSQMCLFYGHSYLFPIVESLGKMFSQPPSTPPLLPFEETAKPHDLGVDVNFWICIERVHTAARTFDRELWAENRTGSSRVWELLTAEAKSLLNLTMAKDCRVRFFRDLEEKGEISIQAALDTIGHHIFWLLVMGGESATAASAAGGNRQSTGAIRGGPYALPPGTSLESPNNPAVKALAFCLRALFIQVQAALNPQSLSAFWTSLSMKLYDILVARLLQHYFISTVGAVLLSRDVESLRSVALLAGTNHSHWENLRELLTLYMTPPESIKTLLLGADTDMHAGKGLFDRVGKKQSLVFLSRRIDYRFKSTHGFKKSSWVVELLVALNCSDPTDSPLNVSLYTADKLNY